MRVWCVRGGATGTRGELLGLLLLLGDLLGQYALLCHTKEHKAERWSLLHSQADDGMAHHILALAPFASCMWFCSSSEK